MSREEFFSLLDRLRVPHVRFGRSVLIDVSKFYEHMAASLSNASSRSERPAEQSRFDMGPASEKSPSAAPGFAILTKKQVAELLQCSSRQVEILVQKGRLPSPVYLGDSSPRWKRSDIEAVFEAVHPPMAQND